MFQGIEVIFLSLSLSHTHTHTHARAHNMSRIISYHSLPLPCRSIKQQNKTALNPGLTLSGGRTCGTMNHAPFYVALSLAHWHTPLLSPHITHDFFFVLFGALLRCLRSSFRSPNYHHDHHLLFNPLMNTTKFHFHTHIHAPTDRDLVIAAATGRPRNTGDCSD
uniref:Uncharacterized protein n=1 Tax=Anopheles braziliensis TaxID=58242 RepID=A0A2M3ZLE1_9DIPT